jgi:hypothetical protein
MDWKNECTTSVTELNPSTPTSKARLQPFVPFGAEPVEELKQDKVAYGVPWLGLIALFISILTIITSWLILHLINDHVVFTNTLLKPAVSVSHFNSQSECLCLEVMALCNPFSKQRLSSHCFGGGIQYCLVVPGD